MTGTTRVKRRYHQAAARAREGKIRAHSASQAVFELPDSSPGFYSDGESEDEVTTWQGGVNHYPNEWSDTEWEWEEGDDQPEALGLKEPEGVQDSDLSEAEGDEIVNAIINTAKYQAREIERITWKDVGICQDLTEKEWKKAETGFRGSYSKGGLATSTKRKHRQKERERNEKDKVSRQSESANKFCDHFGHSGSSPKKVTPHTSSSKAFRNAPSPESTHFGQESPGSADDMSIPAENPSHHQTHSPALDPNPLPDTVSATLSISNDDDEIFMGYASDFGEEESELESDSDVVPSSSLPLSLISQPPPKRRRLAVSARETRRISRETRISEWKKGLEAIESFIDSKKTEYDAGHNSLQEYRAHSIQSCLHMVVKNSRKLVDASERAAESHGFAAKWGGRMVRVWVRMWVHSRVLPISHRGRHTKTWSLLNDPNVRDALLTYLRSHKWATDPAKLAEFTKNNIISVEAQKYVRHIVDDEIPRGICNYLESTLFPHIGFKPGKTISLTTAREWLGKLGWKYQEHKKALYYDGHERPDVVEYRQRAFIPHILELKGHLVEYVIGEVGKEVDKGEMTIDGGKLVLVAHDEVTCQANDGQQRSWGPEGEQPLRKKGKGRGIHYSGCICSTRGHLKDAGQIMEYGKNYEGYWNGELFIKQLKEKIIPTFEKLHGKGWVALFLIDNSQGHSAYAEDALLADRMNLKPGGKQARMRHGWFMRDGQKICQPMIYPSTHPSPELQNQPKGMRAVLEERGLWRPGLLRDCKEVCPSDQDNCCCRRILQCQPDFKSQRSLVQETIEDAGHLCIFLPKYHCELNPIEFFWGAVKKYLRENCDYTFEGLKRNFPLALNSVDISTIRRWEHRMWRWIEAYKDGMNCKDAQARVRKFSSHRYKSHRRVPETLARQFDV